MHTLIIHFQAARDQIYDYKNTILKQSFIFINIEYECKHVFPALGKKYLLFFLPLMFSVTKEKQPCR
jgi:hypothetical protein